MNIIGSNATYLIINGPISIFTISIVDKIVLPFTTNMNKVSSEKMWQLLDTGVIDSIDMQLKSEFLTDNCIDVNFSCHDFFFVKLEKQFKLTTGNFEYTVPFLSHHLLKNQAEYRIDMTNNFGVDFEDSELADGEYVVMLNALNSGGIFKKIEHKYCFASTRKIARKSGIISKSLVNNSTFIYTVFTTIHKRISIKTNIHGDIGRVVTISEIQLLNDILELWPEIKIKNGRFINIIDLLCKDMTEFERELFKENHEHDQFIFQCEGILAKSSVRSCISHIKI